MEEVISTFPQTDVDTSEESEVLYLKSHIR